MSSNNPRYQQFIDFFGTPQQEVQHFFSPGRVNLMGEHVDYNGGQVLPIAIPQGIAATVAWNDSRIIRIRSMQGEGELVIDLSDEGYGKRSEHWQNYPLGVIYTLWKRQQNLKNHLRILDAGCDILLDSNLPAESGLSSSAALEMLIAFVIFSRNYAQKLKDIPSIRVTLALLCQKAENNFVGVQSGIMDQFAVAMGQHNNAILLDCQTLKFQYVPFQSRKYTLLILNSNKPRQLTESKYNERKSECDQALAILQQQYPHIKNLCEAQLVELDAIPFDILYRRAYHVVTENQRTVAAAKALVENDWLRLGELFNESQFSLRDMYEVTGFELDILVELAQQLEGCIGARMTGAGFGGCAIALVETDKVTDFKITLALQYQKLVQLPLSIYEATAENGVDTVA